MDGPFSAESLPAESLRERTRRAVQGELLEVAQRLFVSQGFEVTTVDQIAAAAGTSKRSFFRYFRSKEDLVLTKYERSGEDLARAMASRPPDEPLWISLRHILQCVVDYTADPARAASMAELDRIVSSSDSLRGAYLARIDRMQENLTDIARARSVAAGVGWAPDDPAPRSIVGAAFACLAAARTSAGLSNSDFGTLLDRAMAAVTPLEAF